MVFSLAEDEEYELLPKHELETLKKEVEHLKKHPFGDLKEGETILEATNNLNHSVRKLIDIFTKAEADLAKQYTDSSPGKDLKTIKDQNEEIARGLVTVADMIKEMKGPEKPSPPPLVPPPKGPSMLPPKPDSFAEDFLAKAPPPPGPPPGLGTTPSRPALRKKRRRLFSRK